MSGDPRSFAKAPIHALEKQAQMQRVSAGKAWGVTLCATLALFSANCSDVQGDDRADRIRAASGGLVFVREVEGSSDLMWVDLSDGSERAIAATPNRNERWPYWSIAANHLVFQGESLDGGNSDLLLWSPKTGGVVPLRESDRRDERWPVWSPVGDSLVYAFRDRGPRAGIASESISGGAIQILAFSGKKDFFFRPSFSADGSRLVAQRRGPDGTGSNLWILAPEQVPTRLTDDTKFFDMKPWFTRAGDQVVYSRRSIEDDRRDIAILTVDTGTTRIIASRSDADDHSGRPSPTRDEIAFSSDRNGSYGIFLTDLEGESVRSVTHWEDRDASAPRWSPDGERLVLTVHAAGARSKSISNSHIVVIDRSGRVELDVAGAMADWMPAW